MFRLSWGNGPVSDLASWRAKSLPNTVIHDTDTFMPYPSGGVAGMEHFHLRVSHRPTSVAPDMDAWTWYTKWRDLWTQWKGTPEVARLHGLAVDEVLTNQENVPRLVDKITQVNWWCASAGVPRPDIVLAIIHGQQVALAYVVETYLACYEGADFGLARARDMLGYMADLGVHGRTIYGFNASHYAPGGADPGCVYYNAYGTAPSAPNPGLAAVLATFAKDVVAKGLPFGFGIWTPGYTSAISRADLDSALAAVGA
jgi:hypothetical protein